MGLVSLDYRLLSQPLFREHRREPQRRAERPALSLVKPAAPKAIDWLSRESISMPEGHRPRRRPNQGWLGWGVYALQAIAMDGVRANARTHIDAANESFMPGNSVQDWAIKYPCTRMHGAAFEAEFYPAENSVY